MEMAVGVAGEVVGLTDSLMRGMDRRLNAFFDGDFSPKTNVFAKVAEAVGTQWHVLLFTMLDVMPAIRKRRKQPKEDVISHLIGQGYSAADMLTECITYAAAGMVTTREFITVCAWHMLENPALADRYRSADEAGRNAILEELLRLEPVVGTLFRRALEDIDVGEATIPAGALIAIDVRGANSDPAVVGDAPLDVRPDRCPASRAAPSVISFGDGHHRCPGSFLALQETDIFLTRLLAVPGLKLDRPPNVTWNDLVTGYELRNCIISCD
jgi:cytochrome P450